MPFSCINGITYLLTIGEMIQQISQTIIDEQLIKAGNVIHR